MNSIVKKPWGSYQILKEGKNHLVKNIIVKPGEKLSLQSHRHRSEHWIIVEGIARVTINKTIKTVKSNESIFIPKTMLCLLLATAIIGIQIFWKTS